MKRERLYLVTKKNLDLYAGPITRMGLWDRFPEVNRLGMAVSIGIKLILLAVMYYLAVKWQVIK